MADTQLDTADGSLQSLEPELASLPVVDLENDGRDEQPVKKSRLEMSLEIQKETSKDRIKWIPSPTGSGIIPFVKDWDTQLVHSGRCKMELSKIDGSTVVECMSGCGFRLTCGGEGAGCTCLCHLLRSYYEQRDSSG